MKENGQSNYLGRPDDMGLRDFVAIEEVKTDPELDAIKERLVNLHGGEKVQFKDGQSGAIDSVISQSSQQTLVNIKMDSSEDITTMVLVPDTIKSIGPSNFDPQDIISGRLP